MTGIIRVMPGWAVASIPYFIYIAIVALLRRGLGAPARVWACVWACAVTLLALWGSSVEAFWLRGVLLPPATLLVAYWTTGFLWVAPMPRIERFLMRSDAALRIQQLAARVPRLVAELLEAAYVGVYPLIPIALWLHLAYAASPDADRFWTVILVTDFICFGMLPWIQTRPPRALEMQAPWRSRVRSFNVRLLGETSIGVNTVPSGHAAEALACALLVSGAPLPVQASMWTAAFAVSAGAVFGRYHFAVDAIAGWCVALVVWAVFAGR